MVESSLGEATVKSFGGEPLGGRARSAGGLYLAPFSRSSAWISRALFTSVVNEADRLKKLGKMRRTSLHKQQKELEEGSFPRRLVNRSHCCQRQIKTL